MDAFAFHEPDGARPGNCWCRLILPARRRLRGRYRLDGSTASNKMRRLCPSRSVVRSPCGAASRDDLESIRSESR